jgi:hypothetical protein
VIEFTIEGNVHDSSFSSACASGTVKLYKTAVGGGQTSLVSTVTTDASGNYSITFERDKSEKYRLDFSKSNYFNESFDISFSELNTNEPYKKNFSVQAVATIRWIIKNVAPQLEQDQVTIQKLNGRTDATTTCANTSFIYSGANVNDTLACNVAANFYTRFNVVNLAQGVYLDSISPAPFQTVDYFIDF